MPLNFAYFVIIDCADVGAGSVGHNKLMKRFLVCLSV